MKSILKLSQTEDLIAAFFQESEGNWHSERRYYTLPQVEIKEIVSILTIKFLQPGREELRQLAQLHGLSHETILSCGAKVSWESTESVSAKKQSKGETLFGALGNILYRDRGFATPKPVTAQYHFSTPQTLCLRTEYNDSVFEEELRLIGKNYRTRQSIISRAGEQLMIGQYLEKRVSS
jgi:hypothetical protein